MISLRDRDTEAYPVGLEKSKELNSFSSESRKERQNIEQRNNEEEDLVSGDNLSDSVRGTEAYFAELEK